MRRLQVRERGIPASVPLSELSNGARLILTILTILHQERRPSLIAFEDLDRGLHTSHFGKLVDLCRTLVQTDSAPPILATTRNPYLVDQFLHDTDAVVLVEKVDACTTFVSLTERLDLLRGHSCEPLGDLWYSGLLGGVPDAAVRHLPRMGKAPRPTLS